MVISPQSKYKKCGTATGTEWCTTRDTNKKGTHQYLASYHILANQLAEVDVSRGEEVSAATGVCFF